MTATQPPHASIMVVSDNKGDAELIAQLLVSRYPTVGTSTVLDQAAFDFEEALPDVLLLAFDTLAKADKYCVELNRTAPADSTRQHRKIVLCSAAEVQAAYEQCLSGSYHDYVLFWPLTGDSPRLLMATHLAIRSMVVESPTPNPADFAREAQKLATMEPMLESQMAQGRQHLEAAAQAIAQAEIRLEAAVDGMSSKLVSGELSHLVEVKDAAKLDQALAKMKVEKILPPIEAVAQSMQPLNQWAKTFKQQMQPHANAARSLKSMVSSITPVILVVDDDSIHRNLVRSMLVEEKYKVVLAANARDAMGLLDKARPNLILMDLVMPEVDGLQALMEIKSMPAHANVPIMMITSKSDANVVRDSLKAGAIDFIVKPVRPIALLAKVSRALRPAGTLGGT